MGWFRQHLDLVLFRVSDTPITPLSLLLLVAVFAFALVLGPAVRSRSMRGEPVLFDEMAPPASQRLE